MMQLASDTMYQAGSKTILDIMVAQNSTSVYQVTSKCPLTCLVLVYLCWLLLLHHVLVQHLPAGAGRLPR